MISFFRICKIVNRQKQRPHIPFKLLQEIKPGSRVPFESFVNSLETIYASVNQAVFDLQAACRLFDTKLFIAVNADLFSV